MSRNKEALERAALEIGDKTGVPMIAVAAELGDRAGIAKTFHRIAEALGGVDILINNSGGPPKSGAAGIAPEQWQSHFEAIVLNVIGPTEAIRSGSSQAFNCFQNSMEQPSSVRGPGPDPVFLIFVGILTP